jgi:hypothetical protein
LKFLSSLLFSFSSQKWFVFRRFAQFDELDKRLKKKGLLPVTDNAFMGKWQKMKVKGNQRTESKILCIDLIQNFVESNAFEYHLFRSTTAC